MMHQLALRREDGLGLGVAVVLHLLLVAALLWQIQRDKRVTFGGDGAVTVTLADGFEEAGGSIALGTPDAPTITETPDIAPPEPLAEPVREVERPVESPPEPRRPTRTTQPVREVSPPKREPTPARQPARSTARETSRGSEAGQRTGRSETGFDGAFGNGSGSGSTASVKADIKVSIGAQVAPHWNNCRVSGLDIDQLRAVVSFRMDRSGRVSSIGTPRISGENASNAAQVGRFSECAVRALRLVGTFDGLPEDRYDLWSAYEFEFRKQ
ncbi:hypothetical protein ACXYL9_04685 [Qipengyuania sp. CAU 1752]